MQAIPIWLVFALRELGVKEKPGETHSKRIQEYLATVIEDNGYLEDETPWCSAFVSWCMRESGVSHTATALAQSWLRQLEPLAEPKLGCVVVFWRGRLKSWQGHVGFFVERDRDQILVLGGNQANAVSFKYYARAQVLGYRWPGER